MNKFTYRIYGLNKNKGWEMVDIKKDKEEAIDYAKNLSGEDYYKYIVIEHDHKNNSDFPIDRGDLYQECTVKYEDIKTGIEVKATEIKFNRAKNKQELKRMTEQYIDR